MKKDSTNDLGNFDSIEAAIEDIAQGKAIIVTDDEARENEGDLIMLRKKRRQK